MELPEALKTIGDRAFARNGVKDVTWSPKLTSIGMAAFQEDSLTAVMLPDTVTFFSSAVSTAYQPAHRACEPLD